MPAEELLPLRATRPLADGIFTVEGSRDTADFIEAEIDFVDFATADHGSFTINGGAVAGAPGGVVNFTDKSTAGDATFVINGADPSGAEGGQLAFGGTNSSAGDATIIVNGGDAAGGQCAFEN